MAAPMPNSKPPSHPQSVQSKDLSKLVGQLDKAQSNQCEARQKTISSVKESITWIYETGLSFFNFLKITDLSLADKFKSSIESACKRTGDLKAYINHLTELAASVEAMKQHRTEKQQADEEIRQLAVQIEEAARALKRAAQRELKHDKNWGYVYAHALDKVNRVKAAAEEEARRVAAAEQAAKAEGGNDDQVVPEKEVKVSSPSELAGQSKKVLEYWVKNPYDLADYRQEISQEEFYNGIPAEDSGSRLGRCFDRLAEVHPEKTGGVQVRVGT